MSQPFRATARAKKASYMFGLLIRGKSRAASSPFAIRELRRSCHCETHLLRAQEISLFQPPSDATNCLSFSHLFLGA